MRLLQESNDGIKLIEERFLTMTFPVLIYLHAAII